MNNQFSIAGLRAIRSFPY